MLGYEKYYAQGGDWGAIISSYIALVDPQHCIGIHLNLVVAPPPRKEPPPTQSPLNDHINVRAFKAGILNMALLVIQLVLLKRIMFSKEDLKAIHDMKHFAAEESGYSAMQGTKPQTLVTPVTQSVILPSNFLTLPAWLLI